MYRRSMGLLSRFQKNTPPNPASDPPKISSLVWRKADFISVPMGNDVQVVYPRRGTPASLPSFTLEFVANCLDFAPIESHIADYAALHGLHSMQVDSLREWLPRLIEAGALTSSEHVRAACAAMRTDEPAPAPIGIIGFPTGGDRVPLLARALESFALNLRQHGRTAEFVVADSSTHPEQQTAFRTKAGELAREFDFTVSYSGEEERRLFAAALVERGACRPESIEFALLDPLATGFACGANRNALLLHGAGKLLCSVDDDVVCRLSTLPEVRPERVSMFSNCDPFARWLFADRAGALAAAKLVERDFLAAHEGLLGRSVGDFFPPELTINELSLVDAGDDLLRRLAVAPAHIRTTFLGHFGDPGIPSSSYYLYYERANRDRMVASEEHYRATLSSRSVLAAAPALSIGDASVSPGMAMGFDHRELLPPFFPVLHAEDFIFGSMVWQCCAGSVAGHLPLAILHDPPPGKSILTPSHLGPQRRVVLFEFAHLLRRVIRDVELPQRASTADRTRALGRALSEIASMPLVDFMEVLRQKLLEHESEKLGYLDKQLEQDDMPEFWRRDVEHLLLNARESLAEEDFDIPHDLKTGRTSAENRLFMQTLIARYGQLVQEWPAIVEATRELQESGIGLAVAAQ
ncbi:MAG: hypothetical protein WCF18_25500 [Chthoniobacteraceae bacterium]